MSDEGKSLLIAGLVIMYALLTAGRQRRRMYEVIEKHEKSERLAAKVSQRTQEILRGNVRH